jgi:hypothetical protein
VRPGVLERERESSVGESRGVVPVGGTGIYREAARNREEIAKLKAKLTQVESLIGTPPVAASGQGDNAVKAQAPTGIYLVTHQQWLYLGAMQLVGEICGGFPYMGYTRTIIERVVQQQLDTTDGSTTPQQIRSRWLWSRNSTIEKSRRAQTTYTIQAHPQLPQQTIAVMRTYYNDATLMSHDDRAAELTLYAPGTNPIPYIAARTNDTSVVDTLITRPTKSLTILAACQETPGDPSSDDLTAFGHANSVDVSQLTEGTTLYDKLSYAYRTELDICKCITNMSEGGAYILYAQATTQTITPA